MSRAWAVVAEGWQVTLEEFLGKRTGATLPAFDPFDRLSAEYRRYSLDAFSTLALPDHRGFTAVRIKSRTFPARDTVVLVQGDTRVGFVARNQYGSDTVSLHTSVRGCGLAAPFILAAMALRAQGRFAPIGSVVMATRELFNGGCYSEAGLRAVTQAHCLAIERARRKGRPVLAQPTSGLATTTTVR